ncbi:hypothetical protein OG349_19935 [Streptomyces sp. NBC_01317]|uniref:hypothetical protein n=1 Tax=Streptomyces sp. NBC_01317 TaxID=2903822 RepID=UPI002E1507B3|nr:hypothetical protein OG349_19935 [Streptomyces sp. NBC_01317]
MEPKPPRRRGRTTLIVGVAALLGVVAGTATGYTIQADRAPTALPPLSQEGLAYPAKALPAGTKVKALSEAEDSQVRRERDLRELLISKPAGSREAEDSLISDGWMQLSAYALEFESEDYMFELLLRQGFRRVAGVAWRQGEYREGSVSLVQFRPGPENGALEHASGQFVTTESKRAAGNAGDPIKGSGNGRYFVFKPQEKPGFMTLYQARALAHRGDIMLDINLFDTKPISKKEIRTLAERQLERL